MKIESMTASRTPVMMIYGAEGRGKTTLASRFPKPLFFALERGIPAGIKVDAVQGTDSFEGVLRTLGEIYKDGADEYQTLVFDTLDMLEAQWLSMFAPNTIGRTSRAHPSARAGLLATTNGAASFVPSPRSAISMA
jgi:AAA domain